MPRKGENIYKRRDGRWEGRYKTGYNEYGKPKYHSVYGHSYKLMKTYSTYMCFFFEQSNLDISDAELDDEDFITERYDFSDGWASNERIKRMNAGFLLEDFCKLLDIGEKVAKYYIRYTGIVNFTRSIWQ